MFCLLCYESNDECISVDGEQGKKLKVSVLLYKYFRFCFDVSIIKSWCTLIHSTIDNYLDIYFIFFLQHKPNDGDLCVKCWQKILSFHDFYIQIQSIHEAISKSKDTLQIPQETVKVELTESTLKCDQTIDDGWSVHEALYSDPDELTSHSSFGKTSNLLLLI